MAASLLSGLVLASSTNGLEHLVGTTWLLLEVLMSKTYVFLGGPDVSQCTGENRREAWMPRTGYGYYDKSVRQYFDTKRQKRAWLKANGMRECGELFRPNKYIPGREKTKPDPMKAKRDAYIQSCGGVEGLLQRVRERRGNFLNVR